MYFVVDNPAMRSYFAFQPLVLSVTLPAVTGRLWSEEAKTGHAGSAFDPAGGRSDAGLRQICRGWSNGGLMILTSVPLALLTAGTVAVDPLNLASAYFGALLAAAALSALGCAVSCLIPLPAAAYLVSVFFGWLLIFFNPAPLFSPLAGVWPEMPFYLPSALDFSSRYQSFTDGYFGLDGVFYFVSLTAALLAFTGWPFMRQGGEDETPERDTFAGAAGWLCFLSSPICSSAGWSAAASWMQRRQGVTR